MTLPQADAQRQLKHRRQIDVQVFVRPDGLWEVDATLSDVKTRAAQMAEGLRPAGTPIHDMLLRLVVNAELDILQAGSQTRWSPYPGTCDQHGDAYAQLVGLNLRKHFRDAVRQRLAGVRGCTHITELAQVLPTAVMQGMVGEVIDARGDTEGASQPFQINRCHALVNTGAVVREHYPRWYKAATDKATDKTADKTAAAPNSDVS